MTRRQALKIVRRLIKQYEQGDDDDTLAWYLQDLVKQLKEKKS